MGESVVDFKENSKKESVCEFQDKRKESREDHSNPSGQLQTTP